MLKKAKKASVFSVKVLAMCFFLCVMFVYFSDFHHNFIRYKVGSEVVQIIDPEVGGGTGFHVVASSGKVYILTNAHVCNLKDEDGFVKVKSEGSSKLIERKVIVISKEHDMCLVEALPFHNGLKLATKAEVGESITLVGYPNLRPLILSQGEIVSKNAEVTIPKSIIFSEKDVKNCKARIITINSIFGDLQLCAISEVAYQVSAISYPGNSGSPVVNKYGNVIGLLFAGSSAIVNDAYLIKLEDIREILAYY